MKGFSSNFALSRESLVEILAILFEERQRIREALAKLGDQLQMEKDFFFEHPQFEQGIYSKG